MVIESGKRTCHGGDSVLRRRQVLSFCFINQRLHDLFLCDSCKLHAVRIRIVEVVVVVEQTRESESEWNSDISLIEPHLK